MARWTGRLLCLAGIASWTTWFVWRVTAPMHGGVGAAVLVLELLAFAVAAVLTSALWSARPDQAHANDQSTLPATIAGTLGCADVQPAAPHGEDDTGEVAVARRGLALLDPRRRAVDRTWRSCSDAAWSLVAIEGMRRMVFAAVLVIVLLTGRSPFDVPPVEMMIALVGAQVLLATGQWLLSQGAIRPGSRLRWSMASVGAGFGDGVSRSGLPIRWATTMATIVVLNLAVSLRGVSDRWTHGLGAMPHDQRVMVMTVSWWLVLVGFAALRTLPRPSLGLYGATRRLEETSTRRLALGATLAVALLGFVAGVLPAGAPA